MKINITVAALLASLFLAAPARAAEETTPSTTPEAKPAEPSTSEAKPADAATKEEVRTLAEEIRRLKLEIGLQDVEYKSFAGMGPAASKIYFAPKGLSIGGYGEAFYKNQLGKTGSGRCAEAAGACDFSDILRAVLYTGYRFSDKILFNSEVEFEHQSQVFVEFAYLDFLLSDKVGIRVGNVLVPMGVTNELHEPVFFNGVERPEVERNIIPTTWNENGIGLHGEIVPGLSYKVYGLQGLNAAKKPSPGSFLRSMRTRGGTTGSNADQRALTETFAGVAALAYQRGPVAVGGSVYHGRAGQGQVVNPTAGATQDLREIEAEITMVEAHGQVAVRGATLRALAVQGTLGDAALINAKHGLTGAGGIASRVRGAYVEGAFDVLTLAGRDEQLIPFLRYELLKLHDDVPTGFTKDPGLDVDLVVTGLTFKPVPSVALKADYAWRRTGAATNQITRAVNVGATFVF